MQIRYFAGAAEAAGTVGEEVAEGDLTGEALIARLGADNVHASLADFARAESGRGRQPE